MFEGLLIPQECERILLLVIVHIPNTYQAPSNTLSIPMFTGKCEAFMKCVERLVVLRIAQIDLGQKQFHLKRLDRSAQCFSCIAGLGRGPSRFVKEAESIKRFCQLVVHEVGMLQPVVRYGASQAVEYPICLVLT